MALRSPWQQETPTSNQRAPAQMAQPHGACRRRGADCRAGEPRLLAPASPKGCVAPPAAAEHVCPHSGVSPCALKPCRDAPL